MKILYLNLHLPDHRVEKAAYLAKKAGHKIYFAGKYKSEDEENSSIIMEKKLFDGFCNLIFTPKNKLGFNLKPLKDKLNRFCEENEIDLIHANNVYCANLIIEMDIPFVFDDHEFYSLELKYLSYPISKFKNFISHEIAKIKYPRWEKKIIKNHPIITVSSKIIESYKKINPNSKAFLVPNMPLLEEIENYPLISKNTENEKLKTVYVGLADFSKKSVSYRNTTGILDLWKENDIGLLEIIGDKGLKNSKNITSYGYLSQQEIFDILGKRKVGIICWHPHPYHHYCSLNKIFNYVLFGLFPIYPNTLDIGIEISEIISNKLDSSFGFAFKSIENITPFLKKNEKNLLSIDKKEIMKITRKQFILENYQNNLLEAYTASIEMYEN